MPEQSDETQEQTMNHGHRTVLELTVNNHPGVMYRVCGLFFRRACNVEGILCMPIDNGEQSRIWLTVDEEERLEQIVKQVSKLEDVHSVKQCVPDKVVFDRLEAIFATNSTNYRQSA